MVTLVHLQLHCSDKILKSRTSSRDPVLVHNPELGNRCCVESKLFQTNILIVTKTAKATIRGQWNINEKPWGHIDLVIRTCFMFSTFCPQKRLFSLHTLLFVSVLPVKLVNLQLKWARRPTAQRTQPLFHRRGILRHYGCLLKRGGCWAVSGSLHTNPYKSGRPSDPITWPLRREGGAAVWGMINTAADMDWQEG